MFFLIRVLVLLILPLFLLAKPVLASEIKPTLEWGRSTEAPNKIVTSNTLGSGVNAGLNLPLDSNQVVFDNGTFTPVENKTNVPAGNKWASWPQYSKVSATCGPKFELRRFQAKFNLPAGLTVNKVILVSPYYSDPTLPNVFPINDNAYIFLNGVKIGQLGTNYGAINKGFHGTAPIANETDGWIGNGDFGQSPATNLKTGENILDIVAEERCLWGGMGNLELKLEVEKTGLNVPYFNQTNLPWGSQEYDHANTIGPFFCGRTITQCGCAVTSAAMLLKYYGVDKSPDGLPTTPETLNNWLKNNKGYINGDLNWLSVASYSKIAHDKFGTQIIDYLGRIRSANFTVFNDDLNQNRPIILQEPGHFIVATGIQDLTYSINDPRWTNRTTLQSYGNTFQEMRRYSKANTDLSGILIGTTSSTEFLIVDAQGRKTGRDPISGTLFNEIPNSDYYQQQLLVDDTFENSASPQGSGNFLFEALDLESGPYNIFVSGTNNYGITFLGYDHDGGVSEQVINSSGPTEYTLIYSPEPGSQIGVTQIVNIDIKPGNDKNIIELENEDDKTIKVAVLTDPGFDAKTIDVNTIKFGPGEAKEIHNVEKKNFDKQHFKDIDEDGDLDLILHFRIKDTGLKLGDTQACLTGKTKTGTPIQGCNSIKVVEDDDNN